MFLSEIMSSLEIELVSVKRHHKDNHGGNFLIKTLLLSLGKLLNGVLNFAFIQHLFQNSNAESERIQSSPY